MSDLRQSDEYSGYMSGLGWKVVIVGSGESNIGIFIREMGILGAIAKIQRCVYPLPWEKIRKVLRENRVWMVKYEPDVKVFEGDGLLPGDVKKNLGKIGFGQDKWPLLASRTSVLNLAGDLQDIRADLKKDAKYCLKKAESEVRNGNVAIIKDRFDRFYECFAAGARFKKLWIPKLPDFQRMVEIFKKNCFCLTAVDSEDKTIGGVFVLVHRRTAYYYYSTSLPQAKKMNIPYLLVWEAIKMAKERRCMVWDFEGVFDERWPEKGWKGFTHFKKSFGGRDVLYVGSFTKWVFI